MGREAGGPARADECIFFCYGGPLYRQLHHNWQPKPVCGGTRRVDPAGLGPMPLSDKCRNGAGSSFSLGPPYPVVALEAGKVRFHQNSRARVSRVSRVSRCDEPPRAHLLVRVYSCLHSNTQYYSVHLTWYGYASQPASQPASALFVPVPGELAHVPMASAFLFLCSISLRDDPTREGLDPRETAGLGHLSVVRLEARPSSRTADGPTGCTM